MGFFKKRGKPRQYKIEASTYRGVGLYELYVWNRSLEYWKYLNLYYRTEDRALERLRAEAALGAKVNGYGDNYEITELI